MRVTSIQLEISDRTKDEALDSVLKLLDHTPESDLILLPELWPSGYFSFDRYLADSETREGPLVTALREKARELDTHLLMGSMVLREGEDLFNAALLLDPEGRIIAEYRKIHLFGYQSMERKLLSPGKAPVVVDTPWGRCGITTCYDLRFPELFRRMVDMGAVLFLVPSAWPKARLDAWRLFNRARAHENLAYLFSCNCAGSSRGQVFAGPQPVCGSHGQGSC